MHRTCKGSCQIAAFFVPLYKIGREAVCTNYTHVRIFGENCFKIN